MLILNIVNKLALIFAIILTSIIFNILLLIIVVIVILNIGMKLIHSVK